MTGEMNAPDDVRLLADDLSAVWGALEEIATTWRRASPYRPDLPLGVPARLQDAVHQLSAGTRMPASENPGPRIASRLRALKDEIAAAQALTCAPGMPSVGDAALWDALGSDLRRAESRLLAS